MSASFTPLFPELRHALAPMKSRVRTALRGFSQSTLLQIEDRLGPALEAGILRKPSEGDHSRERVFTLPRTFWSWIWQVLQVNTSCREVVRQMQALFAVLASETVDEATGAYCRARKKLADSLLENALVSSHGQAQRHAAASSLLQGRALKIVDGSGLRVADSDSNRAAFPPSLNQFSKPSFPMMKVVALFSAASGAILAKAIGSCHQSELRLLMSLQAALAPRDVLAGDRHFGCFLLAAWLQPIKVDLVARLSTRSRKVDFAKATECFESQDGLFFWRKPVKPSPLLSLQEWQDLPKEIVVRIISRRIEKKGFRTKELTVVTTLLDPELYPVDEILSAYLKRWRMEMCLDDLKTTLGMEMLSCLSPQMLAKELLVFLITHNMLRWLMAQAAELGDVDAERISFKGTLDAFRQWTAGLLQTRGSGKKRQHASLWRRFLQILVADLVPLRPGRQEPRAVKKRSKYPPLRHPRHQYADRWSRNKRRRVATARRASLK
jgi:hypothetical protein